MRSIIIYGTQYGTTQRYAEKLSELTGLEAYNVNEVGKISGLDLIVYIGGLYTGEVKGFKNIMNFIEDRQELILVTVGLGDPDNPETVQNILKQIKAKIPSGLYNRAQFFHLRGGIDYSKLNFMHKSAMAFLYRSVSKITEENRTPETKAFIETYKKQADYVDFEKLNPIADAIRKFTLSE